MQKTQRTFTKEFKLEAVQLVKSSNKPLAQIARDLGIADSTLHHWRKLFDSQGEQAFPGSGHQTAQEEGTPPEKVRASGTSERKRMAMASVNKASYSSSR